MSLTDLLKHEPPLCPNRAVTIALSMADALSASHRKVAVYRDLKPDNVMLVSRGREPDFVELLDFGIAKLTSNAASTHRTRTGMVIGTPHYMSPAQCEGRGNIDHRTDVYALGIVVYPMLTGRVPFLGDGFGEVLVQQMAAPPIAPSAIVPQLPEYVELVVLKAFEKRSDNRYAHVVEQCRQLREQRRLFVGQQVRDFRSAPAGIALAAARCGPQRRIGQVRPLSLHPSLLLSDVGASDVDAEPLIQGAGPVCTSVWMAAADASDAENQ